MKTCKRCERKMENDFIECSWCDKMVGESMSELKSEWFITPGI